MAFIYLTFAQSYWEFIDHPFLNITGFVVFIFLAEKNWINVFLLTEKNNSKLKKIKEKNEIPIDLKKDLIQSFLLKIEAQGYCFGVILTFPNFIIWLAHILNWFGTVPSPIKQLEKIQDCLLNYSSLIITIMIVYAIIHFLLTHLAQKILSIFKTKKSIDDFIKNIDELSK